MGETINNKVYTILNSINAQALGSAAIKVVDTQSFVDYGNNVLNSSDTTETFTATLLLRLARTYYTYRPYESSLKDMIVTGEQWAAIYQKIDANVPDFVADETYDIEDGKSVDQYVVRKPTSKQKLFIKRSPYSNFVTISRQMLKGAFNSEAEFAAFVRLLFGKMRTKLDFAMENLGRLAIANYIGTLAVNDNSPQIVHLCTEYNAELGLTDDAALNEKTCLHDKDFMAYAAGRIELFSKRFRSLSTAYNAEGEERHTPNKEQRLLVYDDFQSRLQHVVQYQAFHSDMVKLREFIEVPYWQAESNRTSIMVKVTDGTKDGTPEEKRVDNIIAVLFDRYALGTFRSEEETLTTPVNARARYYNTFHFAEQLWYNDISENLVVFCLD